MGCDAMRCNVMRCDALLTNAFPLTCTLDPNDTHVVKGPARTPSVLMYAGVAAVMTRDEGEEKRDVSMCVYVCVHVDACMFHELCMCDVHACLSAWQKCAYGAVHILCNVCVHGRMCMCVHAY